MSRFLPDQEIEAIASSRLSEPVSSLFWSLIGEVDGMGRGEAPEAGGPWIKAYRLLNAALLARQRRQSAPGWLVSELVNLAGSVRCGRFHEASVLLVLALSVDLLNLPDAEEADRATIGAAISDVLVPHGERRCADPEESAIARKEWHAALSVTGRRLPTPEGCPILPDGSTQCPPGETYRWLLSEMWSYEAELVEGALPPFPEPLVRAVRYFVYSVMAFPSCDHAVVAMADARDSQSALPPPMEWLAWVACRARSRFPAEAGLARWLLEAIYFRGDRPTPPAGAVSLTGLVLRFWSGMAAPLAPREVGLPTVAAFLNGFSFARCAWDSPLRLAIRQPCTGAGVDAGSFVVSYRNTVMLADSGDRRLTTIYRKLALSAEHHNSWTYTGEVERREEGLPASHCPSGRDKQSVLQDEEVAFLAVSAGEHEAISSFERIWLIAGSHLLIVIDRITAKRPITVNWHFLLEYEGLDLKLVPPDRLVARKGSAGMKLFSIGDATEPLSSLSTLHCHLHRETSPLVSRELTGNGTLVGWRQGIEPGTIHRCHAFCFDTPGAIAGWHLRPATPDSDLTLDNREGSEVWRFKHFPDRIQLNNGRRAWRFRQSGREQWQLE